MVSSVWIEFGQATITVTFGNLKTILLYFIFFTFFEAFLLFLSYDAFLWWKIPTLRHRHRNLSQNSQSLAKLKFCQRKKPLDLTEFEAGWELAVSWEIFTSEFSSTLPTLTLPTRHFLLQTFWHPLPRIVVAKNCIDAARPLPYRQVFPNPNKISMACYNCLEYLFFYLYPALYEAILEWIQCSKCVHDSE